MTIGQLIGILEKYDLSTDVLVDGYEYGLRDVNEKHIRLIDYSRDVQGGDWGGPHEEVWSDQQGKGESGLIIGRGGSTL